MCQGIINMDGDGVRIDCLAAGSRTLCQPDVQQSFPLAYGFFAANDYGVGIMDDLVTDDVGPKRVGQLLRPAQGVKPGTEDREISLVLGPYNF